MFADDTKLYTSLSSKEDGRALQQDIKKLQNLSQKWQIQFKVSKCKVMHLAKQNIKYTYKMGLDTNLDETSVEKDLRVWVDNDLSFNFHI